MPDNPVKDSPPAVGDGSSSAEGDFVQTRDASKSGKTGDKGKPQGQATNSTDAAGGTAVTAPSKGQTAVTSGGKPEEVVEDQPKGGIQGPHITAEELQQLGFEPRRRPPLLLPLLYCYDRELRIGLYYKDHELR